MTEIPYHQQLADASEWINGQSRVIGPQADVLMRLLKGVDADNRMRALSIEGSIARGGADELSDLDTRVWVADDEFDAVLADLPSLARVIGVTVDILFETPGSPFLFVQYADGVQLELLALRASEANGRASGELVLIFPFHQWC